jgi:hypothetical protein
MWGKTKTRYFSVNFQVQGLIFSLIVYQFEVSLHPREAYTSYISTANLIIQESVYTKLPFGGKFKDKQNGWIRSWFRTDELIGQFPSKSVNVFWQIGWVFYSVKSNVLALIGWNWLQQNRENNYLFYKINSWKLQLVTFQ